MPLSDVEKAGLADLLFKEEGNQFILLPLAKHITNHAVEIKTLTEALEYVHMHSDDIMDLLNKRHITKEVLFKYLHKRSVSFPFNATKIMLVKKVIEYWNAESHRFKTEEKRNDIRKNNNSNYNNSRLNDNDTNNIRTISKTANTDGNNEEVLKQRFPIHTLAQQFSEWFFNNYNNDLLKDKDFWPDAYLFLNIIANDGYNENECFTAETVVQTLHDARQQFNFYFLPNLTQDGVQGRMDIHGLAMALACGTLHTLTDCVGVFECAFGLLRDPFTNNNWKCKSIRMQLRSKNTVQTPPILSESDSLKEALQLPTPEDDLR